MQSLPGTGVQMSSLAQSTKSGTWSSLLGAWFLVLGTSAPVAAQLRDSFEGPDRTWQISKEANCGVRVLVHDRPLRESHTGQACEHFQLQAGNGTFLPLVHSIGRAPIIDEFKPTLYVKADRPSLQLMVRVVFPRNIDRGTGQPITSLLRGDMYADVGQWQQLGIRDVRRLLDQEVRVLRTQFGSEIDGREAYIDSLVINAYSAPGVIDVWIDDLEIDGYVNLEAGNGPQIARRTADAGVGPASPTNNGTDTSAARSTVSGSLLMVDGRPFMPRAVQHRGEPLEWLKSLGFNTIKLSSSPSPADLKEARRLNLLLIAPPPYGDQPAAAGDLSTVLAWSLGTRLAERDFHSTRDLTTEIRNLDPIVQRPLLAGVDSGLAQYSRLAQLLSLERPTLGTSAELSDLRSWMIRRSRFARPGTPLVASLETERCYHLGEQLLLFGRGAPWEEDVDPEQLRLEAFHAIAAGARGFVFPSERPLAIDRAPAALRTDAIRLINMELRLLEPWIAGGNLSEEMAAPDGTLQVSTLTTDRSRLLIVTQHAPAQQFVLGPPPRNKISVVVPGVSVSDRAYLVSLAAVKPLTIAHTSAGARIQLDDAPHAATIVVTQDHLAMHHLYRTLEEIKRDACHLRHDVANRRLVHTIAADRRLTELGHPLTQATAWLNEASTHLEQAARLLGTNDVEKCHEAVNKAEHLLARVRRGHWEQTARMFASPAASPCVAQFTTLPLHWAVADRLQKSMWGPNVQAAGDMEALDQMVKFGWQQQRLPPDDVTTDISLSLSDPHSGRTALRLQAAATNAKRAPDALERPPVWVTSSPVPVRQGQLVRIRGSVNVPRRIAASGEGLLVFDSVGGPELGDRVRLTQGWREFTLYRAVPETGELTVTFALTGLGEASIDDLAVQLLDSEPIRPR
jgi:hypothetical protein